MHDFLGWGQSYEFLSVLWQHTRMTWSTSSLSLTPKGSLPEQQQQQELFYGPLSGTTRVSLYQKKHSPTHHPESWSSPNLYQLLPSTTIHSILPVQIACLAIFLHNLSPFPLWSTGTSWSGALHLIFHTFIHPISVFFSFLTISSYLNHRSYNKTFYNNLSISDSRFLDTACIINKLLQVLLSSHYYYFRPSVGIFPREFKN